MYVCIYIYTYIHTYIHTYILPNRRRRRKTEWRVPSCRGRPVGTLPHPSADFKDMCMCIYIYICIYTCTHIHTCIHAYIHAYMHTCIHAYMHTCIHAYMHICIHAYMHTCIHTCMHTCMHTYIHTYIHTYTHTYIHMCVCIYIYIYIYIYILLSAKRRQWQRCYQLQRSVDGGIQTWALKTWSQAAKESRQISTAERFCLGQARPIHALVLSIHTSQRPGSRRLAAFLPLSKNHASIRGKHLSNTTCLMQVFFKSDENCSESS